MPERLAVFIDYQNVHLVAHELYRPPGTPVHDSVVDPVRVAELIAAKRKVTSELVSVHVFRGRPNPAHHPVPNYRGWPDHPPREKGVDVALAIALVESALLNEYDAAVVFSGDTDLLPAIEMAFRRAQPRIEIAAWTGAKPLWFPDLLAESPRRYLPYCHFLTENDFVAVRDETDYVSGRRSGA